MRPWSGRGRGRRRGRRGGAGAGVRVGAGDLLFAVILSTWFVCGAPALLGGTVICASAGVLPNYWNTYLGHIGPAAVMFILAELERFPGTASLVHNEQANSLGTSGQALTEDAASLYGYTGTR